MKYATLFTLLAAATLALPPNAGHAAIDFPIDYSGSYRVVVVVANEFGSNLCAGEAVMSITLLADGKLNYQQSELETFAETPSAKQPPTCDIRPTGETSRGTGTHDLLRRYSIPSDDASLPPMTGEFDGDHIVAEWRYGGGFGSSISIAFDLGAVSHRVAIEPDPTVGFEFHKSILEGKGFKFVFRDPHGRDHLDFSTLKILVGGVDTTQHVLSRLFQRIVPYTEENPDSRTKAFWVKPDPSKLMVTDKFEKGHDLFAIPYNGDWRIELRMCDKGGTCFGKVYDKVYFGPFVSASPLFRVIDGRCFDTPDPFVRIQQVTVGNVGIDAPRTAIYIGLTNTAQGLWTYSLGDTGLGFSQDAWFQGSVQPFVPGLPLASGFIRTYQTQSIPNWVAMPSGSAPPGQRRSPFPSGEFTLVLAAVDGDTGAYRRDEHAVTMCNR